MKPAFTDKTTIQRPLPEVFSFAANFDNAPKFMENIIRTEKLTEGPIGIGTRFKETREIRAREVDTIIEVIDYSQNNHYSVQSETNGLKVIYHYYFKEVDNSTEVEFKCEIGTTGLKMLLFKPLIVNILKKEDADHLKKMKKAIENENLEN